MLSRFSCVQLCATLWTVAHQAPLSMEFSRQEYRSGLPCPPPDLPNPGVEPSFHTSPALAAGFFTTSTTFAYQALIPLWLHTKHSGHGYSYPPKSHNLWKPKLSNTRGNESKVAHEVLGRSSRSYKSSRTIKKDSFFNGHVPWPLTLKFHQWMVC